MEKDVAIRMAEKALVEGDGKTAEKEGPALDKGMGIIAQADPHALPFI
jgi:hypothetical protein